MGFMLSIAAIRSRVHHLEYKRSQLSPLDPWWLGPFPSGMSHVLPLLSSAPLHADSEAVLSGNIAFSTDF